MTDWNLKFQAESILSEVAFVRVFDHSNRKEAKRAKAELASPHLLLSEIKCEKRAFVVTEI